MKARPAAATTAHRAYALSLIFKGVLGLTQLVGGVGLLVSSRAAIRQLVDWLTRRELAQDASDPIANWLVSAFNPAAHQLETFYALYLTAHGLLNLGLVIALLARRPWAFPLSAVVLWGFIAYQLYAYLQTTSVMLLVLSGIDLLVIWLIWREYRLLRVEKPD